MILLILSLGPGSALGEKEKKSVSEASRDGIWGEERVTAPFPSPDHRWTCFARRYFSYFCFLPFSLPAELGPRIMNTTLLGLDISKFSCQAQQAIRRRMDGKPLTGIGR